MRREIPIMITAIVGLFMILGFFIPYPWVSDTTAKLQEWFLLIAAFAVVLGVGNLIRVNLHRIKRRSPDWGFKIVTLVALFTYAIVGLVLDRESEIRSNWITRGPIGLADADREEILKGRVRLLDRREQAATILESSGGDEDAAAKALVTDLGLDGVVQAPDVIDLGAVGVRQLDPEQAFADLKAAEEANASKRRLLALRGRLQVTGSLPLVDQILRTEGDGAARRLMVLHSFSPDQAADLVALGPEGIAGVTAAAIDAEMAAVMEEKKEAQNEFHNPVDWIFKWMFVPLQATMFSLLAFFIASAAFRAFRMRTVEAGLLLVAGLLVIIGRVPLGQFDWGISDSEFGFHTIMQWIMNVPNTAAMRGIMMGAAMGVIVMGLKVILGIERSYLGGD